MKNIPYVTPDMLVKLIGENWKKNNKGDFNNIMYSFGVPHVNYLNILDRDDLGRLYKQLKNFWNIK